MNPLAILSFVPTLLSIVGDLPKAVAAFMALDKAVKDAEVSGVDGPTKLANVLNDFEVALGTINPAWAGDFDPIAKDVEGVVNELVAFYNSFAKPAAVAPAA